MDFIYKFCNNCGYNGHVFHQCKFPITSNGILAFRYNEKNSKYEFFLVRRKNTLGYVEFMRGKYNIQNIKYIKNLIDEMTIKEKENLLTVSFDTLWRDLWGVDIGIQYRSEEVSSRFKFNKIKENLTLENIINESETFWKEPEWGIPKGRRNYKENDFICAKREFFEETGYTINDITYIENIQPSQEIFTGSNYKSYKHKYYICKIKYSETIPKFQECEISKSQWFTYEECKDTIRPYNIEKIDIIKNLNTILTNYTLY